MKRDKALVVFSGGQDSTTCLYWALRHFGEVHTMTFAYGQKHSVEIEAAERIAGLAGVDFHLMDISQIASVGKNSLTDSTMVMDDEKPENSVPNTFVPGRNLLFLSIAAVYARESGIYDIVTGVSQTDFSGYPDCRDSFIRSLNVTLNLAMDGQFVIHTPLFEECRAGEIFARQGYCPEVAEGQPDIKRRIMSRENDNLKALGRKISYRDDYAPEVLETFENRHRENDYWVRFNCPEFTTLCPITGQPDFAEIVISYIPDVRMVESKSLKLYLFSFRNHGDFHEDCVNVIMKDLIRLMEPKYIEVTGLFTPRGGISIHPYANYGRPGTKYEALAVTRFEMHQ